MTGWQRWTLFTAHQIGAFILIFGMMWLLVHLFRLDPDILYYFPAIFFIYFGASIVVMTWRRRKSSGKGTRPS